MLTKAKHWRIERCSKAPAWAARTVVEGSHPGRAKGRSSVRHRPLGRHSEARNRPLGRHSKARHRLLGRPSKAGHRLRTRPAKCGRLRVLVREGASNCASARTYQIWPRLKKITKSVSLGAYVLSCARPGGMVPAQGRGPLRPSRRHARIVPGARGAHRHTGPFGENMAGEFNIPPDARAGRVRGCEAAFGRSRGRRKPSRRFRPSPGGDGGPVRGRALSGYGCARPPAAVTQNGSSACPKRFEHSRRHGRAGYCGDVRSTIE